MSLSKPARTRAAVGGGIVLVLGGVLIARYAMMGGEPKPSEHGDAIRSELQERQDAAPPPPVDEEDAAAPGKGGQPVPADGG